MFDNLSSRLDRAFKTLKGHSTLTELNIAETVKEIRRALIDADVSYKIAKDFTARVKDKAIGENVLTSVSPGQLMTKIVSDELKDLLGGETKTLELTGSPSIILIAGLQGSGKTTFSGKLAMHLKSKGRNPLLVACDVYRPAAINQIKVLGEQVGVN
ncbi:MAG: signal recognition particle receptor subunit alpha, partial [Bacteroidia bacterium]